MLENRENIEKKILDILTYLDEKTLAFPLQKNMQIFSTKELERMLEFLECGDLKIIYLLLDEKYKEYLGIKEELKRIHINAKKEKRLSEEEQERKLEKLEIETLFNF